MGMTEIFPINMMFDHQQDVGHGAARMFAIITGRFADAFESEDCRDNFKETVLILYLC